ncbi:MAG: Glutamate--tRNA ligase [Candidatus Parcubacteria bacterium]|jgi:glutamyl-tRNA synthetase
MLNTKVVTRFAPSPTGLMHVGGVRTALYAYLYAKKMNGTFILRIEDTDKEREMEGSIDHIMQSLRYILAADETLVSTDPWDFGPNKTGPFGSCVQSERLDIYVEYAQRLFDAGFAYTDPYTKEEIEIFRTDAELAKKPFLFRNHRPTEFSATWDKNKPLRFKVAHIERTEWVDEVRGTLSAGPEALDDFILIKSDGYPTYNLCHIIDDIEMGVTHVMRGEEFIASTPKFIAVYKALQEIFPEKNIQIPVFVTLPPILGATGTKKLSKRDGAKDVLEYHTEGYLPAALANYLALQGWNPGGEQEIFTMSELIELFDISRIQKSGARWNEDKLLWVNKEHIKLLTSEEQSIKIIEKLPESILTHTEFDLRFKKVLPLIIERISVFEDVSTLIEQGDIEYYFNAPKLLDKNLFHWKGIVDPTATVLRLQKTKEVVESAKSSDFDSPESTKTLLHDITEQEGRGEILWPLRTALSAKEKSTDPFTIMYIIGKEEVIQRIQNAINTI